MRNPRFALRDFAALVAFASLTMLTSCAPDRAKPVSPQPGVDLPGQGWELVFDDEFERDGDTWKEKWISDAQAHKHILSSRWPENVSMQDGKLLLTAKKESRGGQDWTAGSIWTKERFQYGYFECRYRYAAAPALNNSFWLMNHARAEDKKLIESGELTVFEIDVNEGHYPNKISTNIHRWTPKHTANSRSIVLGSRPLSSFPLEIPVTTQRLRILSRDVNRTSIAEVRAFAPTKSGYPEMADEAGQPLPVPPDQPNLLAGARATANSKLRDEFPADNVVDGVVSNASRWVGADSQGGNHEVILELGNPVDIGCIQVFSGWRSQGEWTQAMSDFTIQYWDGADWVDIAGSGGTESGFRDLSAEFHTYGLLWTPEEIIFYFDGKEIRREPNVFCHHPSPVFLSLAVIHWAGPVTDRIDGASQVIDYVRIWQRDDWKKP